MKKLNPAIIQENKTGEVLMLGYMDRKALIMTKKEGVVYFWSRSRNKLWKKGETTGNLLKVIKIYTDCDSDAFLIKVRLIGNAVCHTGNRNCFYKII
ncbi:phosphoribosyl-AMP cyclohydrolase [Candidatus Gottesmanbacteria bacterium]|nr:phosphoribosyl-AMP cyclohydrolase [Candidatus Gottesmanbacteria bacterium]